MGAEWYWTSGSPNDNNTDDVHEHNCVEVASQHVCMPSFCGRPPYCLSSEL